MKKDEHYCMSCCPGTSAPIFEGRGVPHCSMSYREQLVLLHRHFMMFIV